MGPDTSQELTPRISVGKHRGNISRIAEFELSVVWYERYGEDDTIQVRLNSADYPETYLGLENIRELNDLVISLEEGKCPEVFFEYPELVASFLKRNHARLGTDTLRSMVNRLMDIVDSKKGCISNLEDAHDGWQAVELTALRVLYDRTRHEENIS